MEHISFSTNIRSAVTGIKNSRDVEELGKIRSRNTLIVSAISRVPDVERSTIEFSPEYVLTKVRNSFSINADEKYTRAE